MKLLLSLSLFLLSFQDYAQQRIGIELYSPMLNGGGLEFNFAKVVKRRILLNTGFHFGSYNGDVVFNDTNLIHNGHQIHSAYEQANGSVIDTAGNKYHLLDYSHLNQRAIGTHIGIGTFLEFGVIHGLRINGTFRVGFSQNSLLGYYRSPETYSETVQGHRVNHWFANASLDLSHLIRLTGRTTLYWGLKLPYFFSIDSKFKPRNPKDRIYGFEPQLALGFTRVIGKCD